MVVYYQRNARKNEICGRLMKGDSTKELLLNAPIKQIFLLRHRDLDEMAAVSLMEKKAKAVINAEPFMSGKYPNRGPLLLLQAGIPLYQISNDKFECIPNCSFVEIREHAIYASGHPPIPCEPFTIDDWQQTANESKRNLPFQLSRFIDNTLHYAEKEKHEILRPLQIPNLNVPMEGRHVVIVVRGSGYKEDLEALKPYIEYFQPVLIGVDGGADALLEFNYKPSLIVGDMDSVSDEALTCGAEIVVHAFLNGEAPGLKRVESLGLAACTVPAAGTSEDLAMLLAYESNAELIVAVGTHTHMIDFLEKGRRGMGSTLLVRMKLGPKLVDAKGISKLYQSGFQWNRLIYVPAAAIFPLAVLSLIHPGFRHMVHTIWIYLKLTLF